jgi:uncharacterized membrane protein YraQ (UPF0718 family)
MKRKLNIGWNLKFLIITLLIYIFSLVINKEIIYLAFKNFVLISSRILPSLLLVFLLLFLTNYFIDNKKLLKIFSKENKKGWLIAIVGGIISSGLIYLWYPLLSDLKEKGIRSAHIACFLYNRSIKIPLLPVFIYYFEWNYILILLFYTIIFSVILGILIEKVIQ